MAEEAVRVRRRGRETVASGPVWRGAAVTAAVVALALVVGWPLAELFATVSTEGVAGISRALAQAASLRAAANTLWTSAAVTLVAVSIATGAALVTERTAAPGRRALRAALVLTLLVPGFVSAQSWAAAYGPFGLLDDLAGLAMPGTFGAAGVVVVMAVHAVPLAYLVVGAGLRTGADPDLERAARASGAGAVAAFRTVTLPLLRPALLAAGVLVFVLSVNAFGVPAVLGLPGGFVTMTTLIYRDFALAADPIAFERAIVLAAALVALAIATVGIADAVGLFRRAPIRTGGPRGSRAIGRGGAIAALGLAVYVVATAVVPLVALVLAALTRAVGLAPTPRNWTLANFAEELSSTTLVALRNSLVLALASATIVIVLGALLVAIRKRRAGRAAGTAAILTFALPGSTLAVAVLLAYGGRLRDTLLLILIAYVAKLWALGHRTLAGSVDALSPDVVRAARASGADAPTTLRTVIAPLVSPAIAAAWGLVFLTAIHELTMSSLLYGPGTATLAVVVLNAQQLGDATVTSALAVVLTGIVVVAAAPLLALPRVRRALAGRS